MRNILGGYVMFHLDAGISQVAVAVGLSILSGVGVYLHGRREDRLRGGFLDFSTELLIAVTAGLMAYYVGQYRQLDKSIIYFSVLLASNNGQAVLGMAKRVNTDAIIQIVTQVLSKKGGGK